MRALPLTGSFTLRWRFQICSPRYMGFHKMPLRRLGWPKIVEVCQRRPDGPGTPWALRAAAMAWGESPATKSSQIWRTIAASSVSIASSPGSPPGFF
nr:hypothetical protein [Oceanicaulis sp. HTCC2633]